ncbi:MAG: ABC transporter ATP-binding protein, partial [Methanomicrobiales archaeon]
MSVIRNAIRIMAYLFGPFKKLLLLYLLGVLVLSGLEVFRVSLVYPIINYGLKVENQPKLLDAFYAHLLPSGLDPFIASALLLLATTVVIAVVYGIVAYGGAYVFSTVRDSFDRQIFSTVMNHEYRYFARKKQGDLLYIGQGAVTESGQAVNAFVDFMRHAILAFLYLVFLFYLSVPLTVALIILGIVYAYLVKNQLFTRVYRNSSELTSALMQKSVVYQEFIAGIKTIFITGSIGAWKEKYDYAVRRLRKAYTNVQALGKLPSIINDFIMFSVIALGAILLYIFTAGDFLSYIGIFGTFMLGLYRLVPAVSTAQSNLSAMVQYLPALTLVYNELTAESADARKNRGVDGKEFSFTHRIEFSNVSFRYPDADHEVIGDLSFTVPKNHTVAIVGDSGSGKTTIANLLARLYPPDTGTISIDETDIREFNRDQYLSALGYIGQETFVYHDTIRENIRFGLDRTDDEIIEAAKRADAHQFIMLTDQGYETIIGDQGMKLSGGQRQRIAIARIILRDPEILLLDEATSSLDNISEKRIIESIRRLAGNMTVITIAHRLSTIQDADVI